MIKEVQEHSGIQIYTKTSIKEISGEPGNFSIKADQINGSEPNQVLELHAGSIVLANGWKPYDASKLTEYAYGQSANIITAEQLEQMAKRRYNKKSHLTEVISKAYFLFNVQDPEIQSISPIAPTSVVAQH